MKRPRRPSPALVVGIVALFAALGGTGYAALRLPANSVGTKQLRKGSVTGSKVRRGTLLASHFRRGQLPRGADGPRGPAGSPGTARAYGVVAASGALNGSRSSGVASVSKPSAGTYCIALAAGIDAARTVPVSNVDFADPASSSRDTSQIQSNGADCPPGRLEVLIRRIDVTATTPPTTVAHRSDGGFAFVVP
jgi:hypothetical protein